MVINNSKSIAFSVLRFFQNNLTAYDLFALTVAAMLLGHFVAFLCNNEFTWLRIPDRILLPVFLISAGFNSAKKPSKVMWTSAFSITLLCIYLFGVFRLFAPAVILITQILIEPVMNFLIYSWIRLWLAALFLLLICYHAQAFLDFGTMGILFAMAGWINVNRGVISEQVVRPWEFFVFTYVAYSIFVRFEFKFDLLQSFVFQLGLALVMWLLIEFRVLLLNSIKRKPKDHIEKICYFLGHKSMLIYLLQQPFFMILYYIQVKLL